MSDLIDLIEVQVTLRERNQLTLPDRIAARIAAKPGDRLLLTVGRASRTGRVTRVSSV